MGDDTFLIGLRLDEMLGHALCVPFLVLAYLGVVTVIIALQELAWVFALLDDPRDLFETLKSPVWAVENHVLEHLLQVLVECFTGIGADTLEL